MNIDAAWIWPVAGVGWFLVTFVRAARDPKTLLLSVVPWIVGMDVFAILDPMVTSLFRHSFRAQTAGITFMVLPYAILLWLLIRFICSRSSRSQS